MLNSIQYVEKVESVVTTAKLASLCLPSAHLPPLCSSLLTHSALPNTPAIIISQLRFEWAFLFQCTLLFGPQPATFSKASLEGVFFLNHQKYCLRKF